MNEKLFTAFRRALRAYLPSCFGYRLLLVQDVKQAFREAGHSPQSSAEIKNEWISPSILYSPSWNVQTQPYFILLPTPPECSNLSEDIQQQY